MKNFKPARNFIAGTALMVALILPLNLAIASAELNGTTVGQTAAEITTNLVAQGYEVRKVKQEDGMLEVYALKDGKRYEVYVDVTTGKVMKVKE